MSSSVSQEPAYLVHRQDYRESSLFLNVFTLHYGMQRLIAKGAKRPRNRSAGELQPFQPLLLSWVGKGELKTLTALDVGNRLSLLKGERLFCGFYLNELLQKLLQLNEPMETLFSAYSETLFQLTANQPVEPGLRNFELTLLDVMGVLPDFSAGIINNYSPVPEYSYQWVADQGFISEQELTSFMAETVGQTLLPEPHLSFTQSQLSGIARRDFSNPDILFATKRLTRLIIHFLLDGRPLRSRDLIIQTRKRYD